MGKATKSLTFITGNAGKAEQLSHYLQLPINHHALDLIEIQSLDLEEVIKHKAIEAYKQLKSPVLVDDTSLIISSFGKLPGTFIKFFLKELGSDKICKLASQFPDKSALAEVAIGLYDGSEFHNFTGIVEGKISDKPKGTNGFGWDPIFIPDGYTKTRGEMDPDEYDLTSPRRIALEKLAEFLKENNYGKQI